ncbi:MAG: protein kinase [Cyanobacteria bacterium CRU_2_1]|nr:protein kinase [Cyanobacteria bacterium RU_5_0]NJR58991.1 protein kinase [Cyanobacteria bacterium CRU_2_1]
MIGQILDRRYQITRSLSSGGFGETFLAQDIRIPGNPLCVVKQLKPSSNDPRHLEIARQLFSREAEALAQLGYHDQIPRLLAYFTEAEEFYLVQEFIEGHILEEEMPIGCRWTEEQVINLLQEVLTILVFVHAQGVIHRDIKPANIIRRQRDDRLVLIDFGAIKQVQIQPDGTGEFSAIAPGTRIGTIGYMPTEQAQGKPRPSSDIYALGMIAVQALTGIHPSQLGDDNQSGEIVWQHLVQVSPTMKQILLQMTRYHAKHRYQSAIEVLHALRPLTEPPPPAPVPPPVPIPVPEPVPVPALEMVPELTLEWTDSGQIYRQAIYPQQPSKQSGSIRIGRDPAHCDIVLTNLTVSGLHVEIFYHPPDQHFYVRNLRQTNPPLVDGQPLPQGERVLSQGSLVRLGQVELRIATISLKPQPVGHIPPPNPPAPAPLPHPVESTEKAPLGFAYNPPPLVQPHHRQELLNQPQPYQYSPSPEPPIYNVPSAQDGLPYLQPSPPPESTQPPKPTQTSSALWFRWLLATTIGSIAGWGMTSSLSFDSIPPTVVAGGLIGAAIGAAQWFVLQQRLVRTSWWIVATAIGYALGFLLTVSLINSPSWWGYIVQGVVIGALAGGAQWLILQRHVDKAIWWIVATTLGQAVGEAIAWVGSTYMNVSGDIYQTIVHRIVSGGLTGLLAGAITGAALAWLLQNFAKTPIENS